MQASAVPLRIAGRVVASTTRRRLGGVTVEAFSGEHQLGRADTDDQGVFVIPFSDESASAVQGVTVTFVVCYDRARLVIDQGRAHWTAATSDPLVTLEVDDDSVEGLGPPSAWVRVNSLASLRPHQAAILERIAGMPNGGLLFTVNPFLLLADIGVELTDAARAEIVARLPHLAAVSATAYQAIKANPGSGRTTVLLHGLFEKGEHGESAR